MKKLLLFLSLTIISQIVCSQKIVLTFQPADGTLVIDSVKTTDPATSQVSVTEGAEITLPDETTSVKIPGNDFHEGKVYPNPFNDYTSIQFASAIKEDVVISVTNAAGQVVLRQQKNLLPGLHRFQLSVQSQGMHFITISGKEKSTSLKAICMGSGGSLNKLTWQGISPVGVHEKSQTIEEGKLYHFEIYSGESTTVIADSPTESKTYEVEFHECKDADGKNYKIVQIGEQWWMAENLAYLPSECKLEGQSFTEPIYYVFGYSGSSVSEAKETSNYKLYGVLYNWSAAEKACPGGWHLPTDSEWGQLAEYVSEQKGPYYKSGDDWYKLGKHLKAANGWNSDGNGTDDFGLSFLPGGYCRDDGNFLDDGYFGYWWSSTESTDRIAWFRSLFYNNDKYWREDDGKHIGYSVRCIKD